MKGISIGKKELKISIFTNDMFPYIEKILKITKEATIVNKLRKFARYKINTQNSVVFLHMYNEQSDIKEKLRKAFYL